MRFHSPVQPAPLTLGQQVHLAGDPTPWTVRATTEHFAVLVLDETVRQTFVIYTVLDWRNGVRATYSSSTQPWGDGFYTEAECAAMLAEFESGELEVSHRNQVPIRFGDLP